MEYKTNIRFANAEEPGLVQESLFGSNDEDYLVNDNNMQTQDDEMEIDENHDDVDYYDDDADACNIGSASSSSCFNASGASSGFGGTSRSYAGFNTRDSSGFGHLPGRFTSGNRGFRGSDYDDSDDENGIPSSKSLLYNLYSNKSASSSSDIASMFSGITSCNGADGYNSSNTTSFGNTTLSFTNHYFGQSGKNPVIVLDCGCGMTKAGFSGNVDPMFVLPTCVATPVDSGKRINTLKGTTMNSFSSMNSMNSFSGGSSSSRKFGLSNTSGISDPRMADCAFPEKSLADTNNASHNASRSDHQSSLQGFVSKNVQNSDLVEIGHLAYELRYDGRFLLNYPISGGSVDWDNMERMWSQILFRYLKATPENQDLLLSEPMFMNDLSQAKLAEIFFETFNCRGLRIEPQAKLAMYGCQDVLIPETRGNIAAAPPGGRVGDVGYPNQNSDVYGGSTASKAGFASAGGSKSRTSTRLVNSTGLLVDLGHRVTKILPVAAGFVLNNNMKTFSIGGKDVSDYIHDVLVDRREGKVPQEYRTDVASRIKSAQCYVCKDVYLEGTRYEPQNKDSKLKTWGGQLPRKLRKSNPTWTVDIGSERFLGPELYFRPQMLSMPGNYQGTIGGANTNSQSSMSASSVSTANPIFSGAFPLNTSLVNVIDEAIQSCPIDYKRDLYRNIILTGGSSQFIHFSNRVQRELKRLVTARTSAQVRNGKNIDVPQQRSTASNIDVQVRKSATPHAVWRGGSIYAESENFKVWTRQDYDEYGSNIMWKQYNDIMMM